MKTYERVEVQHHALSSALNGASGQLQASVALPSAKKPPEEGGWVPE
jgi:hypothetical protein